MLIFFFLFPFALILPKDYAVFKKRFLHVLVQQPLSTFPFCAAGKEQALLCRRPLGGSGLLSAP